MVGTQNETREKSRESLVASREHSRDLIDRRSATRIAPSGFTLTELLVVITIIGILASLITGAALRALNRAKQAAITTELQQLASAMAEFKNEYGIYPPNVFPTEDNSLGYPNSDKVFNRQTLQRSVKKISSRSTEFNFNADATTNGNNVSTILFNGLSPAEALVFWLQGFSADIARPLSGSDLAVTQIDDNGTTVNNVITIDSFTPRFEFDRGRLRFSRKPNGDRRFLAVNRADGSNTEVYIQLYEYFPKNSQQPYVYFDTSRETPLQVASNWQTSEFFYQSPSDSEQVVFPIKQVRADAPADTNDWNNPKLQYVDYVEKGKFQILHAGLDDIWGNFSRVSNGGVGGELDATNNNTLPSLLVPEGPFVGDIADTLGNFMDGTLEDKQE